MADVVALDASLAGILRSLRGPITAARRAYPDVLHVEIRDERGDLWRLATQDADLLPSVPADLVGHSVESAHLDEESGELQLGLSGDSALTVVPAPREAEDDPPNWKLLTPGGLVLVFGPGDRWQFQRADEPSGLPPRKEIVDSYVAGTVSRVLEHAKGELFSAEQQRYELRLLEERSLLRREQLFLSVTFGLSIVSVAAAVRALVFSLR